MVYDLYVFKTKEDFLNKGPKVKLCSDGSIPELLFKGRSGIESNQFYACAVAVGEVGWKPVVKHVMFKHTDKSGDSEIVTLNRLKGKELYFPCKGMVEKVKGLGLVKGENSIICLKEDFGDIVLLVEGCRYDVFKGENTPLKNNVTTLVRHLKILPKPVKSVYTYSGFDKYNVPQETYHIFYKDSKVEKGSIDITVGIDFTGIDEKYPNIKKIKKD